MLRQGELGALADHVVGPGPGHVPDSPSSQDRADHVRPVHHVDLARIHAPGCQAHRIQLLHQALPGGLVLDQDVIRIPALIVTERLLFQAREVDPLVVALQQDRVHGRVFFAAGVRVPEQAPGRPGRIVVALLLLECRVVDRDDLLELGHRHRLVLLRVVLGEDPLPPPGALQDQATAGLWILVVLGLIVDLGHRRFLGLDLLVAEALFVQQRLGLAADVLEQLVLGDLARAALVVVLGLQQALGVGVGPAMALRVVFHRQHQHHPAIALGGQDVAEQIHVMRALTDQHLLPRGRIVEPRPHRVVPPGQRRVAPRIRLHVRHVVGIVHRQDIAALARGLASHRGRDPVAVLVVDVAVLLVLGWIQEEQPAIALLVPARLQDVPALHCISQRQVVSIRAEHELDRRVVGPPPGRPHHRHRQALGLPRRDVDDQVADVPQRDVGQVIADRVQVPVRLERPGLDQRPGCFDVPPEITPEPLGVHLGVDRLPKSRLRCCAHWVPPAVGIDLGSTVSSASR